MTHRMTSQINPQTELVLQTVGCERAIATACECIAEVASELRKNGPISASDIIAGWSDAKVRGLILSISYNFVLFQDQDQRAKSNSPKS